MEPYRDDPNLTAALRALRPAPRPEFAAELDARAASGFPPEGRFASRLARLTSRLRSTPPRRLLAPAGAFALSAIIVATAVVSVSEEQGDLPNVTTTQPPAVTDRPADGQSGGGITQYSAPTPSTSPAAGRNSSSAGSAVTESKASSGAELSLDPSRPPGPYASQTRRRDIERSAQMVLGADPADVRADATKVFDAVHVADGIVLRSAIRDGEAGDAGAEFDLLIPSAKLGDALAAFSAIAEVRSRHEATQDITAPTVSTGERLQDSQAKIESLLGQLAASDTDAERTAVEAQLRAERRHSAALRSRLSSLRRRASFSRVSLRIETGAPSATTEDEGGWGVSDGLDDAGRILAVAAGVTVIALAILGPLALIAFLAWLAHRALTRRSRERALD
jgi:Domain of unknown function (DUF4349)